jgi:hypothetical protein
MGYEIRIDGYHSKTDTPAAVEKKAQAFCKTLDVFRATITDEKGTRDLVKQKEDTPSA